MIDFLQINPEDLNTGQQLLQSEIAARGWTAEVPYSGCPHIFIQRTTTEAPMHVFSTTPPTSSFASAHLADNKYATTKLLESIGVSQLPAMLVGVDDVESDDCKDFIATHGTVVVKPVDGGHGKGITVGITRPDELADAVARAVLNTKSLKKAVMQKQYMHERILDIRIACINYEFVAATHRTPATVVGDGKSSIRQLIEDENTSGRRGEPYHAQLAFINADAAARYLGSSIDDVLAEGEARTVLGVANYGAGGEIIDITDDIPQWMIDQSIAASRAVSLPVCGVDFMLSAVPTVDSTPEEIDPVIVELNKCPSLAIHDKPTRGKSRNAVGKFVDYLATL